MPVIREAYADNWCVKLDLADQLLQIEIPESVIGYRDPGSDEDLLSPTLPWESNSPVSAATLLLKAKQFDDGLYAAIEVAAQSGIGHFMGKASLLRTLANSLRESSDTATTIYTACRLGKVSTDIPLELKERVHEFADKFLADEKLSKPLGFYTRTPELSAIFRQDRLLQQPLDDEVANALLAVLSQSKEMSDVYESWLRLNARITNPAARPGLSDDGAFRSFIPASRSHEQVLAERLYGDRPIPENFDLISELIQRIRSGDIDLNPGNSSGWYDYQIWALGSLLMPNSMPEAARIKMGKRYCDHLEELFRGALALARETHVKQLAIAVAGCALPKQPTIYVQPDLRVEPLPNLYARRAEGYRFVRSVLDEAFGKCSLQKIHRLNSDGASDQSLADELAYMEGLFDGAAAIARCDLGMESEPNDTAVINQFLLWKDNLASDKDVGSDVRMMVPVFYDQQRRKTKVWAFLGWRTVFVNVNFLQPPKVVSIENSIPLEPESTDRLSVLRRKFQKVTDQLPTIQPKVKFDRERYEFVEPVIAEVYVDKLLDRNEFRRHCDRYLTREAILANLR